MKVSARSKCRGIALGLTVCCSLASSAQTATPQTTNPQTTSQSPATASDPSVFALDVIAQDAKTTALLPRLTREDFQVTDNGRSVPIVSFGSGGRYSVAPIAVWLVLSCNSFAPPDFASAFVRGKTQYLRPALNDLDKNDAVGVAHWCGDGSAAIDQPPAHDADAAIAALDNLLKQKSVEGANREWQTGMQKMVEMVLDNTRKTEPHRVPVLVFLTGDAGYAFVNEADDMLHALLPGPGIIFGLSNAGYHFDPSTMFGSGEIYFQIHYLSQQTGGQFYGSPDWKMVTKALDYILMQMHFRYTLGFQPPERDGKKHDLKVELTPDGQKLYSSALLRYRPQYIPVPIPSPR